jgi:hypothetical protein
MTKMVPPRILMILTVNYLHNTPFSKIHPHQIIKLSYDDTYDIIIGNVRFCNRYLYSAFVYNAINSF